MQDCGSSSVLINLRVLSQVQPGDRVRGDGPFLEIEARWALAALQRWWRQDTREKALTRIAMLMQDVGAYDIPEDLVRDAVAGVRLLASSTYADDPLTVSRLETICARAETATTVPRRRSF